MSCRIPTVDRGTSYRGGKREQRHDGDEPADDEVHVGLGRPRSEKHAGAAEGVPRPISAAAGTQRSAVSSISPSSGGTGRASSRARSCRRSPPTRWLSRESRPRLRPGTPCRLRQSRRPPTAPAGGVREARRRQESIFTSDGLEVPKTPPPPEQRAAPDVSNQLRRSSRPPARRRPLRQASPWATACRDGGTRHHQQQQDARPHRIRWASPWIAGTCLQQRPVQGKETPDAVGRDAVDEAPALATSAADHPYGGKPHRQRGSGHEWPDRAPRLREDRLLGGGLDARVGSSPSRIDNRSAPCRRSRFHSSGRS